LKQKKENVKWEQMFEKNEQIFFWRRYVFPVRLGVHRRMVCFHLKKIW